MKVRNKLKACAVAVTLATAPLGSYADWIGDFYNSAGAAVNTTTPQAIASQSAVGYSGGGLSWRVPNKNFQPFAITPPSIKAGCGGIDAYLGAYSFPNKDAFVQALRNFGQAAIGYFFELALRTMAPEIMVTLDEINRIAQEVNQFSINSCQAARKSVDLVADWAGVETRKAAGFARKIGEYEDEFAATFGLSTDYAKTMEERYQQNYGKSRSSLTADDAGKFNPVNVNVLRYAIDHANSSELTADEKDLIMSLVGPSLIITPGTDSDGNPAPNVDGKSATLDFDALVGQDAYAASMMLPFKVLTCDSLPECLNPTGTTKAFKPFSVRAREAIVAIRLNIVNRTAGGSLSAEHQTVLKLSSVPLYRAAAMAEGAGVAAVVAEQLLPDLADYAAIDAATHMVLYYLTATDKALSVTSSKLPQNFQPEVQAMRDRITNIRTSMFETVQHYYKQKGDPFVKIDQLDKAERMMYANLNTMLAANAHFGRRQ